MLNMANNPRLLFKPEAAEKAAEELNAGDENWTFIEIYDEDGEFVDYWKMS